MPHDKTWVAIDFALDMIYVSPIIDFCGGDLTSNDTPDTPLFVSVALSYLSIGDDRCVQGYILYWFSPLSELLNCFFNLVAAIYTPII